MGQTAASALSVASLSLCNNPGTSSHRPHDTGCLWPFHHATQTLSPSSDTALFGLFSGRHLPSAAQEKLEVLGKPLAGAFLLISARDIFPLLLCLDAMNAPSCPKPSSQAVITDVFQWDQAMAFTTTVTTVRNPADA